VKISRKQLRRIIQETFLIEKLAFQVGDSSGAGQDGEFDFSVIDDVLDTVSSADLSSYGYNLVSAVQPKEIAMTGAVQIEVVLQHVKPDFGKFIDALVARGGKFAKIYRDTPSSKTKITRWLTGFKEGSEIGARQKSAAIKVAQLAGLEALQPTLDEIESKYDVTCVANFTGAKTKKKGQSYFEIYVMPPYEAPGEAGIPGDAIPEPPTVVPVDNEMIKVSAEPATVITKPTEAKRKPSKVKATKLSAAQKKKGYNRVNQQGHVRHVLELDELEDIEEHIINIILGTPGSPLENYSEQEAHDMYQKVREKSNSHQSGIHGERYFRIIDDYFDNSLPVLKFYKGSAYEGKIKSRSMMSQYTSYGSDLKDSVAQAGASWLPIKKTDPNYGRSLQDEDFGEYTPPKLGGKESKDARRYLANQRASDEIIIYAQIKPKINRFSGNISKHTGIVTLYVFLLDRNFP
jgi:hypothetical protein